MSKDNDKRCGEVPQFIKREALAIAMEIFMEMPIDEDREARVRHCVRAIPLDEWEVASSFEVGERSFWTLKTQYDGREWFLPVAHHKDKVETLWSLLESN